MINERLERALLICDGDLAKAEALIQLIDLSLFHPSPSEDVKMNFPEDTCSWNHNGECWVDIPDSITCCYGICERFIK